MQSGVPRSSVRLSSPGWKRYFDETDYQVHMKLMTLRKVTWLKVNVNRRWL